jgi:hypothetical protein
LDVLEDLGIVGSGGVERGEFELLVCANFGEGLRVRLYLEELPESEGVWAHAVLN